MQREQETPLPEELLITVPATASVNLDPVEVFLQINGNRDAGDAHPLTGEQIRLALWFAQTYNLDPYQGQVAIMYGRPYLTERGAVANAARNPDYNGHDLEHVPQADLEGLNLTREDVAWICRVYHKGREHPTTDIGVVTHQELVELRGKVFRNLRSEQRSQNLTDAALEQQVDQRLRYLPLYTTPGKMAMARAVRRAHTLAFPLVPSS